MEYIARYPTLGELIKYDDGELLGLSRDLGYTSLVLSPESQPEIGERVESLRLEPAGTDTSVSTV